MKVLLLARSLEVGGAERQLVNLSRGLARRGHEAAVSVFYSGGALEPELAAAGVPLHPLGKRGRWDVARFLRRLGALLSRERPDAIHSCLTTPNCVAAAMRFAAPGARLVWSIRSSRENLHAFDYFTRVTGRLEPRLARACHRIIVNSEAGRARCVRGGFPAAKLVVVPNGIDTEAFRPCAADSAVVRAELGLAPDEKVVGLVARLDPVKDHANFLHAAALVRQRRPEARFLCVGSGAEHYRLSLLQLAQELGVADVMRWVPARADMPAVQNALDVAVLSSYSEGLPNAIGEAMACGVPCVVTDVGDARRLVGETGVVVPPRDPTRLAEGIVRLLDDRRDGPAASLRRQRIQEGFGLDRLIDDTVRVLGADV